MNHFQRARDEALRVRSELLASNAGMPVSAAVIIEKIEATLNIGVFPVGKRASALGNGDAVLKRNQRCIYVRNDLSLDDSAYLVSHELGHWYLDDRKAALTVASLAAMSGAQGTPGVIYVEAYGAHEREELQANVFARELLLPRDIALAMFREGKGPKTIAESLSIPLEVARQQVMDAVMLPNAAAPPIKPLHPMKPDQSEAAKAEEEYVNVIAGPGTGKTSTLIHRVKHLIQDKGVSPAHILVLTFTNKAAAELVDRLRTSGVTNATDLWVGTFHAFGLEFLRKYHHCFNLQDDIRVADDLSAITMLSSLLPRVKLKHYRRVEDPYFWLPDVHSAIKRLKEELVTPIEFRERISTLPDDDPVASAKRDDVATLYALYEQGLRERGMVDFVDLVGMPAVAIAGDHTRYAELAERFQHVLVDEYQDVTEAMVVLVRQLADSPNCRSLWVVGDIRQAIHHWRGASFRSLTKFEVKFEAPLKNGKKIRKSPLRTNFRSSPEVLQFISDMGQHHVLQDSLPFEEMDPDNKPAGVRPALVSCVPDKPAVVEAISRGVQKVHKAGVRYGDQAVLCRWTEDVEAVAEGLADAGIPVLHLGVLPQRPEIKPLLCLMQLLTERRPRALLGFAKLPRYRVPSQDFRKIMDYVDAYPGLQRGRWLTSEIPGLSTEANVAIANIAKLLQGQSRYSTAWTFICDMVLEHRLCLPALDNHTLPAMVSRLALWQFAYSARAGNGDSRSTTLTRYLLRLQLRQRINDLRNDKEMPPEAAVLDAVRVQTVHSSKGLEYEAVHVGFVDAYSYGEQASAYHVGREGQLLVPPEVLGSTAEEYAHEQAIERNNLLYVAASRPKTHLYMYENGTFCTNRAPQLNSATENYDLIKFDPTASRPGRTKAEAGSGYRGDPLTFEEFHTYAVCPLQHWYRYVLKIPREQEVDSALRARFAIMNALREIMSGKATDAKAELERQWELQRLPPKKEDPTLWADANKVFAEGIKKLDGLTGKFEDVQTSIAGVPIIFPWAIVDRRDDHTHIQFPHFLPYMPGTQNKLIRPMVSGVNGGSASATAHSLLADGVKTYRPSDNLTMTDAFAAAQRLNAGDRSPCHGKHCRWCSYITICPHTPE